MPLHITLIRKSVKRKTLTFQAQFFDGTVPLPVKQVRRYKRLADGCLELYAKRDEDLHFYLVAKRFNVEVQFGRGTGELQTYLKVRYPSPYTRAA